MRKLTVSAYTMGYLASHRNMLNSPFFLERVPEINVDAIFYSTLFQAGAEKVEVVTSEPGLESELDFVRGNFLRDRIRYVVDEKVKEIDEILTQALAPFLPRNAQDSEEHQPLLNLISLIRTIAIAVERKSSTVFPGPMPVSKAIEGLVPDEVYYPIKNLLSVVQREDIAVLG